MKKLFALFCAGLLIAMAATAFADVDVYTEVDKDWEADVCIDVNIEKCILLKVEQDVEVNRSAQADVTKNDAIVGNIVLELLRDGDPCQPDDVIDSEAFTYASGVIAVNQASGNCNNQGNAVALATAADDASFLGASVHVEKEIGTSDTKLDPGLIAVLIDELCNTDKTSNGWNPFANLGGSNIVVSALTKRTATLEDTAFQYVTGVIGVNQAPGHCNNQNNAVALAVGYDPAASIAESDLGMVTANNIVVDIAIAKSDLITDQCFMNSTGVLGINQSTGSCNNQANAVSVTVAGLTATF
jgi:hypothetical protein